MLVSVSTRIFFYYSCRNQSDYKLTHLKRVVTDGCDSVETFRKRTLELCSHWWVSLGVLGDPWCCRGQLLPRLEQSVIPDV